MGSGESCGFGEPLPPAANTACHMTRREPLANDVEFLFSNCWVAFRGPGLPHQGRPPCGACVGEDADCPGPARSGPYRQVLGEQPCPASVPFCLGAGPGCRRRGYNPILPLSATRRPDPLAPLVAWAVAACCLLAQLQGGLVTRRQIRPSGLGLSPLLPVQRLQLLQALGHRAQHAPHLVDAVLQDSR